MIHLTEKNKRGLAHDKNQKLYSVSGIPNKMSSSVLGGGGGGADAKQVDVYKLPLQ